MRGSTVGSKLAPLVLALLGLLRPDITSAQEAVYDPAAVKSAFIYHFSTFVNWPGQQLAGRPFIISVMGDDDIARELEKYVPGRSINGLAMQVARVDSAEDLGRTDVLFVGRERADDLEEVIETVRGQPVLVVSDAQEGLDRGAMINFMILDRHVRFEISLAAAERAGLTLSSRLLGAAQQVRTSGILMDLPSPFDLWAFQKGSGPPVQQCVQFRQELAMNPTSIAGEFRMLPPRIGDARACGLGSVQVRVALAVRNGRDDRRDA